MDGDCKGSAGSTALNTNTIIVLVCSSYSEAAAHKPANHTLSPGIAVGARGTLGAAGARI